MADTLEISEVTIDMTQGNGLSPLSGLGDSMRLPAQALGRQQQSDPESQPAGSASMHSAAERTAPAGRLAGYQPPRVTGTEGLGPGIGQVLNVIA